MTLFARLESRNQLLAELIKTGAEPAEAQRLTALAESISQTQPDIDPDYILAVETLLRRDRPGEVLADVIAITHNIRRPVFAENKPERLFALPTVYLSKRKFVRRMAHLSIAAVLATMAVLVVPQLVKGQPAYPAPQSESNHRISTSTLMASPSAKDTVIVHATDAIKGAPLIDPEDEPPVDEQPEDRGHRCTVSDKEIQPGFWVAMPTCRGSGVAAADL